LGFRFKGSLPPSPRSRSAPARRCAASSPFPQPDRGFGFGGWDLGVWALESEVQLGSRFKDLVFGVWGLGFGAKGLGFRVWVWDSALGVKGLGFKVWDLGLRVKGLRFRVFILGFRV